ncbi:MAG: hypothetical protein VW146_05175 [Gammaproteobacteria bacterium]
MEKLKFQFQSFQDLLFMEDHGIYVWGVYLAATILMSIFYLVIDNKLKKTKSGE